MIRAALHFLQDLIIFKATLQHNFMQIEKVQERTNNGFIYQSPATQVEGNFTTQLSKVNNLFNAEQLSIVKHFDSINAAGKIFSEEMAGEHVSYL